MERIIKFRAWEKFDKDYAEEMGKSGEMHFGDEWGENQEVQEKRTIVIAGIYHDSGWNWDDFTVMQFTGLQDKNGVDIYEGDIVVSCDWNYRLEEWGMPETAYKFHKGIIIWRDSGWSSDDPSIRDLWHNIESGKCLKIGNIHENPELLAQPNDGTPAQVNNKV